MVLAINQYLLSHDGMRRNFKDKQIPDLQHFLHLKKFIILIINCAIYLLIVDEIILR